MQEKISFFSRLENLVFAERFIEDLLSSNKLSDQQFYEIQLVIAEAVINAIVHGNKLHPEKYVTVIGNVEKGIALFTIKDEGKGFDFTNLSDPTSAERIYKPYGRGVFLMKKLANKITFLENGSTVCIEFLLNDKLKQLEY